MTHEEKIRKWDLLWRERELAAYRVAFAVERRIKRFDNTGEPIDVESLRETLAEYAAADKKLQDYSQSDEWRKPAA